MKVKEGRQKACVILLEKPCKNDLSLLEANILFDGGFLLLNTAKDLATGSIPVLGLVLKMGNVPKGEGFFRQMKAKNCSYTLCIARF